MIILIALLAGFIAFLIMHEAIGVLSRLQLEKHIKSRIDGARSIQLRGLSGNALFIAEKLGHRISSRQSRHLVLYTAKIAKASSILGLPYTAVTPATFMGIQALAAGTAVVLTALLFSTWNIIILLSAGAAGFLIPYVFLQEKVKERHKALFRQMPDFLDLLSLMIEAGLDFNTAVQRITESEKGALIEELRAVQQEIRLGKSRTDAFTAMAQRVAYLPLQTTVNTFTLAFATGGSIAPALKALAEQFRMERFQYAEKLAHEAPVKLLLPLVIFIFPTIFVILFGPLLLSFLGN